MTRHPLAMTPDMLPQTLPIFPLQEGMLLPGGQLPLVIFEPRYLNMVQDALAARDRLIGFVLPRLSPTNNASLSEKKQPLYSIGCAGRITAFEETADAKLILTLTGYNRFHVKNDIPTLRGYQRAEVSWEAFNHDWEIDPNPEIERDALIESIREYSTLVSIQMDWQALEHTPNFTLVTFFAMSLPFSNDEKQKILEMPTVEERAILLDALLNRAIERHHHNTR